MILSRFVMQRTLTPGSKRAHKTRPKGAIKPRKKISRPNGFKPEYVQQAYIATRDLGATMPDLAKLFGVGRSTINNWCKQHPELLDVIKTARYEHDSKRVEASLLQRALGSTYTEISTSQTFIKGELRKGKQTLSVKVPAKKVTKTEKHILPDVTACIFWLCNRQPELWQNVQKRVVEQTGKMQLEHTVPQEQLKKLTRPQLENLRDILSELKPDGCTDTEGSGNGIGVPFNAGIRSSTLAHGRN